MKLNPKVNVRYQGELRRDKIEPKLWTEIGPKLKLLRIVFSFTNRCSFPWTKFPSNFFSWISEGRPENVKPWLSIMASRTALIPCKKLVVVQPRSLEERQST